VVSQLTSLFLRAGEEFAPSAPGGPNSIVVGDTMAASPMFDGTLAELGDRARAGLTRIVLVDAGTESAVAAVPGLLDSQPDVNVVFVGRPRDAALVGHPRVDVLAHTAVPDLVAMLSVSTVAVTDRYRAGMEALEFGLPTVLVERAGRPSTMPGQVPADPAAVLTAITQLLADHPEGRCRNADPAAASRAEHALAWMFGLAAHPVHGSTDHGSTDHGSTGHDSTGQPNAAANAEE
jgi:UDP-N-acetylglucosamine 2-epimerase (non-hydrolysing)